MQSCSECRVMKDIDMFYTGRKICKDCLNKRRREKLKNDPEARRKKQLQDHLYKKKKTAKNAEKRRKLQEEIGIGNKKCRYCNQIKPADRFRHNRLKCKDCERDEPFSKFVRKVRTRIFAVIKNKKDKHTVEYLGCSCAEYTKYLLNYNEDCTYENYGTEWHIDHVIPLSHFNVMEDEDDRDIAFNWRNTMPLEKTANLAKNNRIDIEQVREHFEYLKKYHLENNLEFPQEFINLFARYLVAGSSLEL